LGLTRHVPSQAVPNLLTPYDTTGFSRVVFQFLPRPTAKSVFDTTGFSRVVFNFGLEPALKDPFLDTTGFSRMVFQLRPTTSFETSLLG